MPYLNSLAPDGADALRSPLNLLRADALVPARVYGIATASLSRPGRHGPPWASGAPVHTWVCMYAACDCRNNTSGPDPSCAAIRWHVCQQAHRATCAACPAQAPCSAGLLAARFLTVQTEELFQSFVRYSACACVGLGYTVAKYNSFWRPWDQWACLQFCDTRLNIISRTDNIQNLHCASASASPHYWAQHYCGAPFLKQI